jgi:transposase-like protein
MLSLVENEAGLLVGLAVKYLKMLMLQTSTQPDKGARNMNKILRQRRKKSKVKIITRRAMESMPEGARTIEGRAELIQMLIPLGLKAVGDLLQDEVKSLAGSRYRHEGGPSRWGKQPGSIYLGDEKFRIEVPRVRDGERNTELSLAGYSHLQRPRELDEGVMKKVLLGLSCGRYEETARTIPEAFGISGSTISRRTIRASARKLALLMSRPLNQDDFVALFIDGKSFSEDGIILVVGVTVEGRKRILGFVQAATEKETVISSFFETLIERGLDYRKGLLCVIDGSKGLVKAIRNVFSGYALIQRCQWHKRENVIGYLPKGEQTKFRRKLQAAYEKPTYAEAREALRKIQGELRVLNQSAAASLEEGLEETLTLHRLGLFEKLGVSFKTTNVIESIQARIGQYTDKVDYWKNSDQKQRWVASALLDLEPRLNRVKGMKYLSELRRAIQRDLGIKTQEQIAA